MNSVKKTALVTGACGGIGSRVVKDLAEKSYHLILVDMNEEDNRSLAGSLPSAEAFTLNLGDRAALETFCEKIPDFGLDVVFVNAGVIIPGDVVDTKVEHVDLQLEVNLRSAIVLNMACAKDMVSRRTGHIINTVSMGGIAGMKGSSIYSASKFGLRGFLASLYSELEPFGVKVSGLYPSAVDTPMLRQEALDGGSVMNFLSTPSSVDDVLVAFNTALKKGPLEICIPYSDGLSARFLSMFPSLLHRLSPMLERLGRRGLNKYLRNVGHAKS